MPQVDLLTDSQFVQLKARSKPSNEPRNRPFLLVNSETFSMTGWKYVCQRIKYHVLDFSTLDSVPHGKYEIDHGISEHRKQIINRARRLYKIMYDRPHAELYYLRLQRIWGILNDLKEGYIPDNEFNDRMMTIIRAYQEELDAVIRDAVASDDSFEEFIGHDGPLVDEGWIHNEYTIDDGYKFNVFAQHQFLVALASNVETSVLVRFRQCLSGQAVYGRIFFSQYNDMPIFNGGVELYSMAAIDSRWPDEFRTVYNEDVFERNFDFICEQLKWQRFERSDFDHVSEPATPEQRRSRIRTPSGLRQALGTIGSLFGSARANATEDDPMPVPPRRLASFTSAQYARKMEDYANRLEQWRQRHPEIITAEDNGDGTQDDGNVDAPDPEGEPDADDPAPVPSDVPLPTGSGTPHLEPYVEPTSQIGMADHLFERMKSKARSYLDDQLAHPQNYRNSSHLRRFGDPNGQPQQLRRRDVLSTDIVIKACRDRDSRRYVLTFGGEDRHPIFNEVKDQQWTKLS